MSVTPKEVNLPAKWLSHKTFEKEIISHKCFVKETAG